MVSKIGVSLFIFLTAFLYLAYFNPYSVSVTLSKTTSFDSPIILLMGIVFFLGAFSSFFLKSLLGINRWFKGLFKTKKGGGNNSLLFKGIRLFNLGKLKRAEKILDKILKIEPLNSMALVYYGNIQRIKGNTEKAIICHNRALKKDSRNLSVLYNLIEDLDVDNRYTDIAKILYKITKIDPSNLYHYYKLRDILQRERRWEEVCKVQRHIVSYKTSEREDRLMAKFYYLNALTCFKRNELEDANDKLKKALKYNNSFAPAYIELARIYSKMDKVKKSISTLKKGFNITHSPIILKELESIFIKGDNEEKMINYYKEIINLNNNNNNSLYNLMLTNLYIKLDKISDAHEILKAHKDTLESRPLYHHLMGIVYDKKGIQGLSIKEYTTTLNNYGLNPFHYKCSSCNYTANNWTFNCPECNEEELSLAAI